MREISGNIWDHLGMAVIAVTTNGLVTKNGRAVFGRGCAGQAKERFPDLAERLGGLLQRGNHVYILGDGLVSFPVEHTPYENPDLRLIERSAEELAELADAEGWERVILPRPGCGGGGLAWKDVKPLLERHLDDRFLVITCDSTRHP
jgi:hypothetical protein